MAAEWFYTDSTNQQRGPIPVEELRSMIASGALPPTTLVWSEGMPNWLPAQQIPVLMGTAPMATPYQPMPIDEDTVLRRLAENERIANIIWLVLGIILVIGCATIIAGILNIYIYTTRTSLPERIRRRDPSIPALYENSLTMIIVSGVVNLVVGGVLGVGVAAFDYYNRDEILKNAHLFAPRNQRMQPPNQG